MNISFRPACALDFDYCKRLYFAEMKTVIEKLHLDLASQSSGFDEQWELKEVEIIIVDGSDVGWVQTRTEGDGLFLAQLFVDHPFQGRGIGTKVVNRLLPTRLAPTLP